MLDFNFSKKISRKKAEKYFSQVIIDYDKLHAVDKFKIHSLITHIISEKIFLKMCIEKIKENNNKIIFLSLSCFIQKNCNYIKLLEKKFDN